MTTIDPELLALATADELEAYKSSLEIELALSSPLDYAVHVSKADRPRHIEHTNDWIVALIDGSLYFDGPGPPPVWTGEVEIDGNHEIKIMAHPERGDRPVYNLAIDMPPATARVSSSPSTFRPGS